MNDTALVKLSAARHALAECKTVMEAKEIADIAEAARVYLERTNASVETVNQAAEIRTLAERQMGAFLKEMPKATGGWESRGTEREPQNAPTLAEIGITKKQSSAAQKLADIPEQEFQERIALTKASGERITPAKIIKNDFSDRAKAAGEAAERESENLWKLKKLWTKTNKTDRAEFLAWAK
jgi:hypothetical protein